MGGALPGSMTAAMELVTTTRFTDEAALRRMPCRISVVPLTAGSMKSRLELPARKLKGEAVCSTASKGAGRRDVRHEGEVEPRGRVRGEGLAELIEGGFAADDSADGVACFEKLRKDVLGDEAVGTGQEDSQRHFGILGMF
ncbi:hypothetical protein C8035_v008582 [Colletotrichum spinosum]|uniref:Uncharacterized protein n=1 Tax=Colletotrichum spinosum TaxID=1347390 RepID=A0A4V6QEA1_9PEZI|nr:hypothetical protein C8035_v008582 [Colletotrichum spinosum]